MRIFVLFLAVSIAVFSFAPMVVSASHGGTHIVPERLVPECGPVGGATNVCRICDIFKLVQNVLNYIFWGLALPLALVMVVYGGLLMVIPWASESMITRGRKVLLNALIGLLIIFLAWLAIDTIIKIIGGRNGTIPSNIPGINFGPWNQIECGFDEFNTIPT